MTLSEKIVANAKRHFEKSGMTLEELAKKMGITSKTARQSAWQLLNKSSDLRISTIEKLADALGVDVKSLF
jgi:transcriptional regulator with XRE-family HTH domain